MNFAPYQSSPPESTRALSPPPERSRRASPHKSSNAPNSTPSFGASIIDKLRGRSHNGYQSLDPETSHSNDNDIYNNDPLDEYNDSSSRLRGTANRNERHTAIYQSSIGLRIEHEAVLAYILLPPAGPLALLIFEQKSDYVRFHAWQSALLFTFAGVLHLLFSWSRVLSYFLLVGDLAAMAYLTWFAFRDAETLDRMEVPIIGRLASSWVDGD